MGLRTHRPAPLNTHAPSAVIDPRISPHPARSRSTSRISPTPSITSPTSTRHEATAAPPPRASGPPPSPVFSAAAPSPTRRAAAPQAEIPPTPTFSADDSDDPTTANSTVGLCPRMLWRSVNPALPRPVTCPTRTTDCCADSATADIRRLA
jgi:hypothetical protein